MCSKISVTNSSFVGPNNNSLLFLSEILLTFPSHNPHIFLIICQISADCIVGIKISIAPEKFISSFVIFSILSKTFFSGNHE